MSNPIEKVAQDLEIEHLVHFTHLENLESILDKGILPRDRVPSNARTNETKKLPGHPNAVCLSISFPNYKMFSNIREQRGGNWVVIKIDPSIMWLRKCHFCRHSGADPKVSKIDDKERYDKDALLGMFESTDHQVAKYKGHILNSREQQKLNSSDPTDPQAEVLLLGIVPENKITGVVFDEDSSMGEYSGERPEHINFEVNKDFFSSREYVREGKPYQSKGKDT